MIRSKFSATTYETRGWEPGFRASAVLELDAETTSRALAKDVVVGAAYGAGAALHAVAEADQVLLFVLVPLVHARRTEVVAVLAGALIPANVLVGDLDVLLAAVLGTVAGALVLGLLSNTGPATGEAQIVFTRRVFGLRGARVGAFLTLFLAVGWFAVDCVIAAQAGSRLLGGDGRPATFIWVLLIAAVSVAVAVYGHATIKAFETFGALAFAALSALLFVSLAGQMHWTAGPAVAGGSYVAAFLEGFMVCFALVASWYPFASDYSRYLPQSSSRRGVTLWPVLGVTLPMILPGLFGLLLPPIHPKLGA